MGTGTEGWDGTTKGWFTKHPWEPWFAWHPTKVTGQWVWLKTIYRRRVTTYANHDDWEVYEFGTLFDVLKDNNER